MRCAHEQDVLSHPNGACFEKTVDYRLSVLQRLLKAKEVFAKADEDKGGSLDVNEFVVAFKDVLKTDEGDGPDALRRLFARIDANADGTVDWKEFSTYTMLENDSAARYPRQTLILNSINSVS